MFLLNSFQFQSTHQQPQKALSRESLFIYHFMHLSEDLLTIFIYLFLPLTCLL